MKTRRRFEIALALLFALSLPLVNPWVRGDGVGYYAYVRSLLIDGDLDFENEWLAGNAAFVQLRVDEGGRLRPELFARTGRIDNHFAVGPSLLWAPFLLAVHAAVSVTNALGGTLLADGYSPPYVWTMGLSSALYGFLALLFAFWLARAHVDDRLAFWATLGVWGGTSLPAYMYFNPSWSHAHSAFAVGLFLWYWHRTRGPRSALQWSLLGLLAGLMINVYYLNAVLMLVPLLESVRSYAQRWRQGSRWPATARLLLGNLIFTAATALALLPTLITRKILYGSAVASGYPSLALWNWSSPELWNVLFSSNHGLMSWTPVVIPAAAGLFLLARFDRELSVCLAGSFVLFYYVVSCYESWHGLSSFGNRFFVSLTLLWVLGLAAALKRLQTRVPRGGLLAAGGGLLLLVAWNAGLVFQWGTHLIPPRGPVSWRQVLRNQVSVVPLQIGGSLKSYFLRRREMMDRIEQQDLERLQGAKRPPVKELP